MSLYKSSPTKISCNYLISPYFALPSSTPMTRSTPLPKKNQTQKQKKPKNAKDKNGLVKRSISIRQVKLVLTRQHAKCNICKIDLNEGLEMDHIIEIIDGGTNDDDNYQALCGSCHNIKTDLTNRVRREKKFKEEQLHQQNHLPIPQPVPQLIPQPVPQPVLQPIPQQQTKSTFAEKYRVSPYFL